jgi:hypothetical protein
LIRIFRGIRRRFAASESARKYALYAAGEVVLVVAGILIALQLNAWREARKDRAFELTMLGEIHSALEADVSFLHDLSRRLEVSENASGRVLRLLMRADAPRDSLTQALWESQTWIVLSFNRGPYDALKSTGIDKVSNDRLRSELIRVYDHRLPRAADFMERLTERFSSAAPLHRTLVTPVLETGPDGEPRLVGRLTANGDVLAATVPELVDSRTSAARQARSRLQPLLTDSERLRELLAAELGITPDPEPGNGR